MARIFFCTLVFCPLLLSSLLALARQSPQGQDLPAQSSSAPAQQSQAPPQAPAQEPSQSQTKASANSRIQDSIEDLLSSDPVLSGAHVQVAVDDRNITLTGTTESYAQHERVLHLVAQYGRWRQIVDKIR
jgi:BON domain-containing protein